MSIYLGMGSRSQDFDDELKISFLISFSSARSKTFLLNLISGFFALMEYLAKWSQSDFTDVNSGRAGGGILCRMFFIEFHRRLGFSFCHHSVTQVALMFLARTI